jgi:exodeoxyribonuclease VII large subunit
VVQGPEALPSLLEAFAAIPAIQADTVILARGGGSLEDLWCFNEERLAHAILRCEVPVVSAVGHETDFTIADFVADLRAPTPTAAAELVARAQADLLTEVHAYRRQLCHALRYRVNEEWMRLDDLRARLRFATHDQLSQRRQTLQQARSRLGQAVLRRLSAEQQQLAVLRARLTGLDPRSTLQRGFSLTLANGKPLLDSAEAPPGTRLRTLLAKGQVNSIAE